MPFVVATYVYANSQGQRTHSARTKNCQVGLERRSTLRGCFESQGDPEQKQSCPSCAPPPELAVAAILALTLHHPALQW